jgi:hypothetical protein
MWNEYEAANELLTPDYPKATAIRAASEILCPGDPDRLIPELEAHSDSGEWIVSFEDHPDEPYDPIWYDGIYPADHESTEFTNQTRASCGAPPYATPTYLPRPTATQSQS